MSTKAETVAEKRSFISDEWLSGLASMAIRKNKIRPEDVEEILKFGQKTEDVFN